MKKVLFLSLMMAMAIIANAQGKWYSKEVKGDELKGTKDVIAYNYIVEGMGSFIFWGFDIPQYELYSPISQFNTKVSGEYIGMTVHVGIYDDNDNLLDKFTMWLDKDMSQFAAELMDEGEDEDIEYVDEEDLEDYEYIKEDE